MKERIKEELNTKISSIGQRDERDIEEQWNDLRTCISSLLNEKLTHRQEKKQEWMTGDDKL